MQSFPEFTADQLMRGYIGQIPGILGKLSEAEVLEVIEKAVNGVSVWSDTPVAKLMTPKQTQKMLELMTNQKLDPNDLASGYQSLSIYNEQNKNNNHNGLFEEYDQQVEDRDVVFLGAESSGILEQNEMSDNQQLVIDQFNREFQQQQQNFIELQGSSGFKQGLPPVYSSDTSQVDNFIFQNNINRFSNEVSQDEYDDITP